MTERTREPWMRSLAANLVVFILLSVAVNGVIFGLGFNKPASNMPGLPPGWVVGSLWVMLFAAMGTARWLLLRAAKTEAERRGAEYVSLLGLLCLLYPLYTAGFQNELVGLVGNLLTAAVAIPIAVLVWRRVRAAGVCVAAVCAWLLYAAVVTARGIWV
jgi:benzodiazapine receptor